MHVEAMNESRWRDEEGENRRARQRNRTQLWVRVRLGRGMGEERQCKPCVVDERLRPSDLGREDEHCRSDLSQRNAFKKD